jgi:N-methylhydantoinase B
MDHGRFGPPGLLGGEDGAPNEVRLHRATGEYVSPHWSKDQDLCLVAGDSVEVRTPGGGGYGDPFVRAPDLVRRDVARGYYTREDAARDYAVALHGDPPLVDGPATAELRRQRHAGAREEKRGGDQGDV